MSTQTLIKDMAGSLYFPLPKRATSVTVTILQKNGEALTTAVAGDACVDSDPDLDTTLSADASAGDTSITLTIGLSALEGSRILLDGNSSDTSEWVEGKAWDAASKTLTLWNPLSRDHVSGVKAQTTTVQVDLAAGYQNQQYDRNICYVIAVIDSVSYRYTYVYSVKLAKFRNPVTELDILRYMPSSTQHNWEETQGWKKQLLAGMEEVRCQLRGMKKDLDDFLNPEDARLAIIWATIWIILQAQAQMSLDKENSRDLAEVKYKDHCLALSRDATWLEEGPQDLVMDDEEEAGDRSEPAILS